MPLPEDPEEATGYEDIILVPMCRPSALSPETMAKRTEVQNDMRAAMKTMRKEERHAIRIV